MGRKRSEWEPLAECLGVDPEIFFPQQGRPKKEPEYKPICARCTVRQDCFEYAVVHEEDGVWGGSTTSERNRLHPQVKKILTEQAKTQGWFEVHLTPELLFGPPGGWSTPVIETLYFGDLPDFEIPEFDLEFGPLPSKPLEELPVEAPGACTENPTVLVGSYAAAILFPPLPDF